MINKSNQWPHISQIEFSRVSAVLVRPAVSFVMQTLAGAFGAIQAGFRARREGCQLLWLHLVFACSSDPLARGNCRWAARARKRETCSSVKQIVRNPKRKHSMLPSRAHSRTVCSWTCRRAATACLSSKGGFIGSVVAFERALTTI